MTIWRCVGRWASIDATHVSRARFSDIAIVTWREEVAALLFSSRAFLDDDDTLAAETEEEEEEENGVSVDDVLVVADDFLE